MARIHPELATVHRIKRHYPYLNYLSLLLSIVAILKAFHII